jgi:hypothetical protein
MGGGLVLATWLEFRDGDRRGDVYASLMDGHEGDVLSSPLGVKLPRRGGTVESFGTARTALGELAAGIVTARAQEESGVSFIRMRLAAGDSALDVMCDSSMTGSTGLRLIKLVPTADHEFMAVFDDPVEGRPTACLRRIRWGEGMASESPEYRPFADPDVFALDAVADGRGGLFVMGETLAQPGSASSQGGTRVFHLLQNGQVDPIWPAGGRVLADGVDAILGPILVADGMGGVYVSWGRWLGAQDTLRAVAVRFDSSGAVANGWDPRGTVVMPDQSDYQTPASLAVGHDGLLFVSVHEIPRFLVAGLNRFGQGAPGWPREGVSLAGPNFILDVLDPVLHPVERDACLVSWSVLDGETSGYDLFSTLLPLSTGRALVQPSDRVTVCAAESNQYVATTVLGVEPRPLVFWSDELRSDPFTGRDGLYFGRASLGPTILLQPTFRLTSKERRDREVRLEWQAADIVDDVPQVLASLDGGPAVAGAVRRIDSRTFSAVVELPACSRAHIQLVAPSTDTTLIPLAAPLDLECAPPQGLQILGVKSTEHRLIEIRLASAGASGPVRVSLYDVAGRRVVSVSVSIVGDGETSVQVPVPGPQGVYWVEASSGSARTSRTVVLVH